MSAQEIKQALAALADPDRAAHHTRYFKTGKGEYSEGDRFLGIKMPELRGLAKQHRDLSFTEIAKLVRSKFHEHRMIGFLILLERYRRGDDAIKDQAFAFCRKHLAGLDNWDLVDTVAPKLLGPYMIAHPEHRALLHDWARSSDLWERRIAMLSTKAFIAKSDFIDALAIARILLHDEHDLIHKAVGWMLREIGERDRAVEEAFLDEHTTEMPRTMLRYAIEKFPPARRKHYMAL